jgi:polysaccharide export outer membrane protein
MIPLFVFVFPIVAALAGCSATPATGPSAKAIQETAVQADGTSRLVPVTRAQLAHLPKTSTGGFGAGLKGAAGPSNTIQSSDVLRVSIFEGAATALLSTSATGATVLDNLPIDEEGNIFVPYAGHVKAQGQTVEQLRSAITEALGSQTPDPQVVVSRTRGDDQTISVVGNVSAQGNQSLTPTHTKLTQALAKAGGVNIAPENALVRVTRGSNQGWIRLSQLFASPEQDITLQPGDRVLVEADTRRYAVVGEAGTQQQMAFDEADVSAFDAIAKAGGLNSGRADPTGVFVYRFEQPGVASKVMGRKVEHTTPLIYQIDLTSPDGMFVANTFPVRENDVLYITEAPLSQWNKLVSSIRGTTGAVGGVDAIAD